MGERVTFASNGDTGEGYLAFPEGGSGPPVILIQEWWGLVGHITNVADRLAGEGFLTLAPDLYRGVTTGEPDQAQTLMMGLAMDRAAKDMAGAAAYLRSRPEASGRGVATVGFCMGGSLALWSATLSDDVVAAVGFYPAVPWERMIPTWDRYAGKAAMIHADEADGTSAAPGIQAARAAIEVAGGSVEVFDYPGTEHAFFNDDRPEVYAAAAAATAWERTVAFLRARLA